jgi:hypothetical protein
VLRTRRGAIALVLSLGTLGGIGGASAAGSSDRLAACSPARVQYTPFPGGDSSVRSPWIRGKPLRVRLVGQIWYWPEEWSRQRVRTARIFTGGVAPAGYSTKILWAFVAPSAANGGGARLVVRGRRLDGSGSFRQQFAGIFYSGQRGPSFASIVDVPEAGCWSLQLSSGALRANVTLLAVSAG